MAGLLLDVDGTLLTGPTSEALFAAHLLARGVVGPRALVRSAAFAVRWAPRFGHHVFKKDKAYLAGLAVDEVAALAERFVADHLAHRLRPAVLRRIAVHRAAGREPALVTGTPDFIAAPLARLIGAVDFAATECAHAGGVFTTAPPLVHPFGADKVTAARALCRRQGWRLSECVAYGDSAADVPLFETVHTAVAVAPDRDLARLAAARGWEIVAA